MTSTKLFALLAQEFSTHAAKLAESRTAADKNQNLKQCKMLLDVLTKKLDDLSNTRSTSQKRKNVRKKLGDSPEE